jgi:pseudouridine kinase
MIAPFARVIALGAATIDRFGSTEEAEARLHTSNIGRVTTGYGGAARNVAEALARLRVPVRLVTALGDDPDGQAVAEATAAAGVKVEPVAAGPSSRTASYTAIFSGAGDLVIGLADMAVLEALTPAALAAPLASWDARTLVFADANLPAGTLSWLAGRKAGPLAAAAVSVQKSQRLQPILAAIDLLVLNRLEAEAILGKPGPPDRLTTDLARAGAAAGLLTLGSDGALAWQGGERHPVPAQAARVRNVNGAGDAAAAALLAGLHAGHTLPAAAGLAMAAAALTVESDHTVRPDLTPALLGAQAGPPAAQDPATQEPQP